MNVDANQLHTAELGSPEDREALGFNADISGSAIGCSYGDGRSVSRWDIESIDGRIGAKSPVPGATFEFEKDAVIVPREPG